MSRVAGFAIGAAVVVVAVGITIVGLAGYPRLAAGLALFVGALITLIAMFLLRRTVPPEPEGEPVALLPSRAEVAARAIRSRMRGERKRAAPAELDQLHQYLRQATGVHAHASLPLRGVMRRIAVVRLADRGLNLDDPSDAERVRELLGPEAWELCGPAVTRRAMVAENQATTVNQLSAAVAALERL